MKQSINQPVWIEMVDEVIVIRSIIRSSYSTFAEQLCLGQPGPHTHQRLQGRVTTSAVKQLMNTFVGISFDVYSKRESIEQAKGTHLLVWY
jgi:hypothetical protein